MKIYIPSRGREHRMSTVENLPLDLQDNIILVVPPDELSNYLTFAPVAVEAPDIPSGIGPCRQWCCDQEPEKVLMMDDDLVFATRREDEPTKFRDSHEHEITSLVERVEHYLGEFAAVGVSTREGGNRDVNRLAFNTRLLRVLAYRTDILRLEGIRFDSIPVMEDFYVGLSLLRLGYENVKLNMMVHNQHGSSTAGGCSEYRDVEMQTAAAHALAGHFPDFVTAVQKTTKAAWGGGTRTDVRIQWKKALQSAPFTKVMI